MAHDGFQRLVAHYREADDARLSRATVEDVALIIALRDSYPEGTDDRAAMTFAGGIAKRWLGICNAQDGAPIEEVRLQPLLRHCLDIVEKKGIGSIPADYALLLHSASELLARLNDESRYERLVKLLRPHASKLRELVTNAATPGLTELTTQVTIVDAELLQQAPRREVTSFAGLAMLSRGAVLECSGTVKFLDDVPDNCTLVVVDGSCLINGHLLGHAAATNNIEVRGNHAGMAIVSAGDLFVGACLSHCSAISKSGSVFARRCEDPKTVFAGEKITVFGNVRGGTFMAPTIEIDGTVEGGQFRVSRALRAARFAPLGGRGPVIELQKRVTCEQAGKLIDDAASRVVSQLAEVRRGLQNADRLIAVATHECECYAASALIFLVGGEENEGLLNELNLAERRVGIIDRLVSAADVLLDAAEDRIARGDLAEIKNDAWREVNEEIVMQLEDNPDLNDLSTVRDELQAIAHSLHKPGSTPIADILSRLREKKVDLLLGRKEVEDRAHDLDQKIRNKGSNQATYDRFLGESSKAEVLSRVVHNARSRPKHDRLNLRSQAPFVQVMLRAIDSRRKRVKYYLSSQARLKDAYDEFSDKLLHQFHLKPPAIDAKDDISPEVAGLFDAGVTICTEACLIDAPENHGESVLCPSAAPDARTYRREGDRIVEVTPE